MLRRPSRLTLAVAFALPCLAPGRALAWENREEQQEQTSDAPATGDKVPPTEPVRPFDVTLRTGFGLVSGGGGGGLTGTVAAVFRRGILGFTAYTDQGRALLGGYRYSGIGAGVGLVWIAGAFRGEIFAVAGRHAYRGVGSGFFNPDPGAAGALPFLGGRASALAEIGEGVIRFQVGATVGLEADIGRKTSTTTYADAVLFPTGTTTSTHTIGGTPFLAQAVVGLSIGP